ncbi:uncharacterized protein MELLADRAFT_88860 [Melampsora larici-populina 98AG31]|uniref:Secreted protein n=1 Tax=Melampsora larici-populina (strain 98AG31 / pathotype 3-4-7) TaxID=747676 RepID=F4RT86_MELLP|nr:uncharacterized protein MELLADRAFT_88860 [Melampsora larici-populina 98AG31]EGG04476.1 secreted protein [Melampsora larici-populina 98AG31]
MFNIFIARALSSWMLFDLVSAQFPSPLSNVGQTFPNQFSQPGGSPGAMGGFSPNGPQFPAQPFVPGGFPGGVPNAFSPYGQPFSGPGLPQLPASGLDTSAPYQCDQFGGQEAEIKLKHCNLALGEFFNYGQWVWSTDLTSSRTCSTCQVLLESQSQFAVAVPAQALKKKVFDILSGCRNRAGLASLNEGVALPFGSFGPVTVSLQIARGKKCTAREDDDDDDDDDDDSDDDDDHAFTSSRSAPGRSTSSSLAAGKSTSSRPASGRTTPSSSGSSTGTAGGARSRPV